MNRQAADAEVMKEMARAYLAAIAILEKRTPEEILANGREASEIIDRIRRALTGDESFTALAVAFTGFLVALADEPEALR